MNAKKEIEDIFLTWINKGIPEYRKNNPAPTLHVKIGPDTNIDLSPFLNDFAAMLMPPILKIFVRLEERIEILEKKLAAK